MLNKFLCGLMACAVAALVLPMLLMHDVSAQSVNKLNPEVCIEVEPYLETVQRKFPKVVVHRLTGQPMMRFMKRLNSQNVRSVMWADEAVVMTHPGKSHFRFLLTMRGCVVVRSYNSMPYYYFYMGLKQPSPT